LRAKQKRVESRAAKLKEIEARHAELTKKAAELADTEKKLADAKQRFATTKPNAASLRRASRLCRAMRDSGHGDRKTNRAAAAVQRGVEGCKSAEEDEQKSLKSLPAGGSRTRAV